MDNFENYKNKNNENFDIDLLKILSIIIKLKYF